MSKDGSHLSWANQPLFLEILPELLLITVLYQKQIDFLSCAILVTRNRCLDIPLKYVIFEHCEEIVFFFELKKNNYLFQFVKARKHIGFGQPAYVCMEQKKFVIRIEILAEQCK
nr:unnamed protein product [Callosobruchus analis]